MDQESWSRPRAFNHIIESFFPETRVGSCAFDFYDLGPGRTPANRDFITYAFLTSLRHSGAVNALLTFWEAALARLSTLAFWLRLGNDCTPPLPVKLEIR